VTYQPVSLFWQAVGYWQTIIAGILAVLAAVGTIYFTNKAARSQVQAAREQTAAAKEQTKAGLRMERRRVAKQLFAFLHMLDAALAGVIDDIKAARELFASAPKTEPHSQVAFEVRQRIKKTGFPDLRGAMIGCGGFLTAPFLDLEKAIDLFSERYIETTPTGHGNQIKKGETAKILEQLSSIETQALNLRTLSEEELQRCNKVLSETSDLGID
jgi:hypothetical protein